MEDNICKEQREAIKEEFKIIVDPTRKLQDFSRYTNLSRLDSIAPFPLFLSARHRLLSSQRKLPLPSSHVRKRPRTEISRDIYGGTSK
jgi:hypothetical protein